jgi:thiol:disulfide interchange protein DsbA
MLRTLAVLLLSGVSVAACARESSAPAGSASTPAGSTPTSQAATAAAPAAADQANAAARPDPQAHTPANEDKDGTPALERLAQLSPDQQLPSGRWKAGVNYKPVVPAQPTTAPPGKVEVDEVFWYGCSHCYALDPFLESWKKNKPAYIDFVRVPVMWGPVHQGHARLFYTLQALGRLDALHTQVFDEIHQRNNMLVSTRNDATETRSEQLAFAKAHGISEKDFLQTYDSMGVDLALKRAQDFTTRYSIEGVPTIIVNGRYETDVGMAGGQSQLIELIDFLAANEKKR